MNKKEENKKEWDSLAVEKEVKWVIKQTASTSKMSPNDYLKEIFITHPELINTKLINKFSKTERVGGKAK